MKKLLLFLCVLAFVPALYANACVSAGAGSVLTAGNWSSCGGVAPGAGDTATINHAMSLAASNTWTVGTSPLGTTYTVDAGTDLVTSTTSIPSDGTVIRFFTSNTVPAGVSQNTNYEVCSGSGATFLVGTSGSSCGTTINFTGTGVGTQYFIVESNALTVNATLTNSGTINFRGGLVMGNAGVVMGASASMVCDSSASADPTNAPYLIRPSGNGQYSNTFSTTGATTATAATLSSHASGTACRMGPAGYTVSPLINGSALNISKFGTSAYVAMDITASGGLPWSWTNGRCNACGALYMSSAGSGSAVVLQNVTFENSPVGLNTNIYFSGGSGSTNLIDHNVFDIVATINSATGVTFTNNISKGQVTGGTSGSFTLWDGNFFNTSTGASAPVLWFNSTSSPGTIGTYIYKAAGTNPHFVSINCATASLNPSLQGFIFDHAGTDTNGDVFLMGDCTGANTVTIKNNLLLPNRATSTKGTPGCFYSGQQANVNATLQVEKNTVVADGSGDAAAGICWLESPGVSVQHAGLFAYMRSSLFFPVYATDGCKMAPRTGPTVDDQITAANANYNGGPSASYNCSGPGTTDVNGYSLSLTSGTPGANDITEAAGLVDFRRNLEKWDASLGGAGTFANAWAEMAKMNDASGFNTKYTVPRLIGYVWEGFRPQNLKYATGAHDGGCIGKMTPRLLMAAII